MVKRAILREEFGVITTPQLTSEYRIVPSDKLRAQTADIRPMPNGGGADQTATASAPGVSSEMRKLKLSEISDQCLTVA